MLLSLRSVGSLTQKISQKSIFSSQSLAPFCTVKGVGADENIANTKKTKVKGNGQTPSSYRLPPGQKVSFRRDPRLPKPYDPPTLMPEDIDEYLKNFDTTLTPEQQEKVARLKRQIMPANGPRSELSF
jgi:hypothetical protein